MRVYSKTSKKLRENFGECYVVQAKFGRRVFYWSEDLDWVKDITEATIYRDYGQAELAAEPHEPPYELSIDEDYESGAWEDLCVIDIIRADGVDSTDDTIYENFRSDVYNSLVKVGYRYRDQDLTEDDWTAALEWFQTHFFDEQ